VAFFARLLRMAPARPESDLERGERAVRRGDFAAAAGYYAAALAAAGSERDRALVHNKRALLELALGDAPAADAALAQALATYPACVPALVNVANRLLEAGDVAAAIERYEAAIRLDPDFPEAHHNLGVAYKRAGRRSDAVRELRRATGLERRRKNQGPNG
jgi:tetratricopeptide (TPR) repeat protein